MKSTDIVKAYLGSSEATKIYLGSTLVYGGGSSLPYDAKVEYLESSGTQYIQLPISGVTAGTYFEVSGTIKPVYKNTSKYSIFSASPYSQFEVKFYSYSSSSLKITYDSTIGTIATSGGWGGVKDVMIPFELSTTRKYVDSVETEMARPLTASITAFRIFGGYRNSNRYPVAFGSFKIVAGTNTLYDLIPVRVGQVGYMYDKISGELFGNSGSGSFVLGNDI